MIGRSGGWRARRVAGRDGLHRAVGVLGRSGVGRRRVRGLGFGVGCGGRFGSDRSGIGHGPGLDTRGRWRRGRFARDRFDALPDVMAVGAQRRRRLGPRQGKLRIVRLGARLCVADQGGGRHRSGGVGREPGRLGRRGCGRDLNLSGRRLSVRHHLGDGGLDRVVVFRGLAGRGCLKAVRGLAGRCRRCCGRRRDGLHRLCRRCGSLSLRIDAGRVCVFGQAPLRLDLRRVWSGCLRGQVKPSCRHVAFGGGPVGRGLGRFLGRGGACGFSLDDVLRRGGRGRPASVER